jgi:PAS domain S-box-containing protein
MLKKKPGLSPSLKLEDFELIFESIMENSKDGLFVVDKEGMVVMVNQATQDMFDFKTSEVLGRNVRDLVKEGFYQPSVSVLVIQQKSIISLIQTTRHKKKILSTGIPIFDDAGQIKFVLVNDRDISHINMLAQSLYPEDLPQDRLRLDFSHQDLAAGELEKMVIKSPAMIQVVQTIIQASKFDIPMILTGESGVGKTMIARLLHQLSLRRNYPFIDLNCAAITPSLIESELFGHERGAFTGASISGKKGLFEMADKGTLFLDEIGEIPLPIQVKLLKFLETMELIRVGGTTPIKINTRIIVATNQDLEEMVAQGLFRRDLYFRLNVVPVQIPCLKKRPEDIVPLALSFLDRFNQEFNTGKTLSQSVCQVLSQYDFPGNVRELENLIKRLVTMTETDCIDLGHLPSFLVKENRAELSREPETLTVQDEINAFEQKKLYQAIEKYGSQRKAAKALGMSQSTLSRKLRTANFIHN